MLLDRAGKLVTDLDFRGTKIEYLDRLTAKDLFLIISTVQQLVNKKETFTAKQLTPVDWKRTTYAPIFEVCENQSDAGRLLGVIIKQALIMSPLLFRQEGDMGPDAVYTRI